MVSKPPSKPASKPASKPKSSAKPTSKPKSKPASTASRRSERLSSTAKPASAQETSMKKRSTTAPKSGTQPAKKAKTEDTGAAKSSKVEKDNEAPKDAEPETDGGKALALGDKLPSIKLQLNDESEVDVAKLAGEKGVVLFLYPKADTPGCTNQACGYRDIYGDITSLGYDVYGLSKDKPAAQQKWADKKSLQYKLICDPQSKLIKRLGAFVLPNNTKRSHFIFEKGSGKLVDLRLGVKPADDPANCLKFLKQHHK